MKTSAGSKHADSLSESLKFVQFMRLRGLDVRLSEDGNRVELFSRQTGKRLCFFPVSEMTPAS